jgi:hypothetical protein
VDGKPVTSETVCLWGVIESVTGWDKGLSNPKLLALEGFYGKILFSLKTQQRGNN